MTLIKQFDQYDMMVAGQIIGELREELATLKAQLAERDEEIALYKQTVEMLKMSKPLEGIDRQRARQLEAANAALTKRNGELKAGIGRLEWCWMDGIKSSPVCPSCGNFRWHENHKPDCWLNLNKLIGGKE